MGARVVMGVEEGGTMKASRTGVGGGLFGKGGYVHGYLHEVTKLPRHFTMQLVSSGAEFTREWSAAFTPDLKC